MLSPIYGIGHPRSFNKYNESNACLSHVFIEKVRLSQRRKPRYVQTFFAVVDDIVNLPAQHTVRQQYLPIKCLMG